MRPSLNCTNRHSHYLATPFLICLLLLSNGSLEFAVAAEETQTKVRLKDIKAQINLNWIAKEFPVEFNYSPGQVFSSEVLRVDNLLRGQKGAELAQALETQRKRLRDHREAERELEKCTFLCENYEKARLMHAAEALKESYNEVKAIASTMDDISLGKSVAGKSFRSPYINKIEYDGVWFHFDDQMHDEKEITHEQLVKLFHQHATKYKENRHYFLGKNSELNPEQLNCTLQNLENLHSAFAGLTSQERERFQRFVNITHIKIDIIQREPDFDGKPEVERDVYDFIGVETPNPNTYVTSLSVYDRKIWVYVNGGRDRHDDARYFHLIIHNSQTNGCSLKSTAEFQGILRAILAEYSPEDFASIVERVNGLRVSLSGLQNNPINNPNFVAELSAEDFRRLKAAVDARVATQNGTIAAETNQLRAD